MNCNLLGNPEAVSVRNSPNFNRRDVAFDFAAYVQDSWTLDRLTVNAGLRMEFARPRNPAAPKPAGRFSAIGEFQALEGLPDFGPDWAPRLSLVYDVFGDARTAAKFGWNRYYHAYGISGVLPLSSYAGAAGRSDTRDWFDVTLMPGTDTPDGPPGCELVPVGRPGSCNDPYGTNGDNIAQDWEIGLPGNDLFPTGSSVRPDENLQRRFDDVLTVGLQQELGRGVSVTLEYRRRWTKDQWFRSYDARRFDFVDGRFMDNDVWVLEDEFLAPWPYTAIIPIYGIYPAAERIPGQVDMTVPGGTDYLDRFTGFEASFTARMPGGGTLFGGWNTETPGVGESAGVWNACSMRVAEGDDPNGLRFCNEFAYPRNWRNEFKLSGAQPLPWDLQLGGSFQLYPGWGVAENFRVDRRGNYAPHNFYGPPWYTEENCVAPCVLGERIIQNLTTGQLGTSTTGRTMNLLPSDTVKYLPDWTLLESERRPRLQRGQLAPGDAVRGVQRVQQGHRDVPGRPGHAGQRRRRPEQRLRGSRRGDVRPGAAGVDGRALLASVPVSEETDTSHGPVCFPLCRAKGPLNLCHEHGDRTLVPSVVAASAHAANQPCEESAPFHRADSRSGGKQWRREPSPGLRGPPERALPAPGRFVRGSEGPARSGQCRAARRPGSRCAATATACESQVGGVPSGAEDTDGVDIGGRLPYCPQRAEVCTQLNRSDGVGEARSSWPGCSGAFRGPAWPGRATGSPTRPRRRSGRGWRSWSRPVRTSTPRRRTGPPRCTGRRTGTRRTRWRG